MIEESRQAGDHDEVLSLAKTLFYALREVGGSGVLLSGEPDRTSDYDGTLIDGDFNLIEAAKIVYGALGARGAKAPK